MILLTNNILTQAGTSMLATANSMVSNSTIWFILAGVIIIIVAIIFAVKKRKKTN